MEISHSLIKESESLNKEIIKENEVKLESINSEIIFSIEKEKDKNIFKEEKEEEQKPIQSKISKIEIEPIKIKPKEILFESQFFDYTNFNIIYLIDTTLSMKKYEKFIYLISNINIELKKIFINMKIGYAFYKDFKAYDLHYYLKKIKIYSPSKYNISLPKELEFSGGYDYSEDWANSIYKIGEISEESEENIIIHICDSNAHGSRFSDYDNKNGEENILIQALQLCKTKNIKFIGLLIDNLAKKSFFECKKIYNELYGFYDIIDLTKNIDYNLLLSKINEKISLILKKKYVIDKKHWSNTFYFLDIDERNFEFNGLFVEMKSLYDTKKYRYKKFTFLPKIEINNFNSYIKLDKTYGIRQGYIGDCYLISSIISMLNIPLIFNYIFLNSSNIDENTKFIDMFIYENGIKKLISFKNTYAINNDELLFVKPYNNEIYAMAIEKGYSVSKCSDSTIKSGYKNIVGGFGYRVFETILGAESEKYVSNDEIYKLVHKSGYKFINKGSLKCKIKKYIDLGGIITFGVYYNLGSAHEYSLQGYRLDKNGDLLLEIINPHRSGRFAEENIYYSKDYKKTKLLKNENKYPIIFEDDFINEECKESLYSYKSTGYMIMEFEIFFRWFGIIDLCDPMIGFYEQIIEFIPNGNYIHSFDFKINTKTKFKAYIFIKNNSLNINNYNFIIKYRSGNIIYNDELHNNNKIFYEILEKGYYIIEIKSKNKEEIKDVIYLKIFNNEKIEKEYNSIIHFGYFHANIYTEMLFVYEFIAKFYRFICINNIYFFEMPNERSIFYNPNNILKNFYIYYINTMNGFYVEVIFKYKWIFFLIIEYRYNYSYYIIYTKYGNFKCSREFYFYDFDFEFKTNIFRNIYYCQKILWSEKINYETHTSLSLSNIIFNNINNVIEKDSKKEKKEEKEKNEKKEEKEKNEKKEEKEKNEKQLKINYKISNCIDVVYLIDSTGSMSAELKIASSFAIENADNLSKNYPDNDFQFGVIYYNDPIDASTDFNDFLQLTKDMEAIKQFCNNWTSQDGGDTAEDWAGGYSIALDKIKWRDGKRIIVHICDAPAHGAKYSKDESDNHKEEIYEYQLDDLMKRCAQNKIMIIGIYKTNSAKNCFLECKKIYENNSGLVFNIQLYNPKSSLNFTI